MSFDRSKYKRKPSIQCYGVIPMFNIVKGLGTNYEPYTNKSLQITQTVK